MAVKRYRRGKSSQKGSHSRRYKVAGRRDRGQNLRNHSTGKGRRCEGGGVRAWEHLRGIPEAYSKHHNNGHLGGPTRAGLAASGMYEGRESSVSLGSRSKGERTLHTEKKRIGKAPAGRKKGGGELAMESRGDRAGQLFWQPGNNSSALVVRDVFCHKRGFLSAGESTKPSLRSAEGVWCHRMGAEHF